MTDLQFMGEVVRGAVADKERVERIERQLRAAVEKAKTLEVALQQEREKCRDLEGQRDRLEQEDERGTLERVAFEWREKFERELSGHKRSRALLSKAEEECRRAKRERNGFVADLQRKMECAGVKMWYLEEGDRGMFVREDVYKAQLECREQEMEKGKRELEKKNAELEAAGLRMKEVLDDLNKKRKLVGQLEGYGESLRGMLRVLNHREKSMGRELERAVARAEKVKEDALCRVTRMTQEMKVERENSSTALKRIKAMRGDVERFRISAKREKNRRLKLQARTFEKVGGRVHSNC